MLKYLYNYYNQLSMKTKYLLEELQREDRKKEFFPEPKKKSTEKLLVPLN